MGAAAAFAIIYFVALTRPLANQPSGFWKITRSQLVAFTTVFAIVAAILGWCYLHGYFARGMEG
jgi:hypothetical protein